jgi:transposase
MMSDSLGKTYRPWEPQHYRQEAHSPEGKLPEGDLVFFLLDTVPHLDLSRFYAPYEDETRGAPPFDPKMMVCLLLYAYCVGVFSSRKIAQACERNLAFIAIVGADRPDFRTISNFRKLHLEAFCDVCVQVLRIAGESGLVKLGNVSTDGTKLQGNASRHKAMSYGYRQKEVERVREALEALVTQAYQQDAADDVALGSRRGGVNCPPSWRVEKTDWPPSRQLCGVWRRVPKPKPRPSANGGLKQRRVRTSVGVAQETWRAPVSIIAGDAARPTPQA